MFGLRWCVYDAQRVELVSRHRTWLGALRFAHRLNRAMRHASWSMPGRYRVRFVFDVRSYHGA